MPRPGQQGTFRGYGVKDAPESATRLAWATIFRWSSLPDISGKLLNQGTLLPLQVPWVRYWDSVFQTSGHLQFQFPVPSRHSPPRSLGLVRYEHRLKSSGTAIIVYCVPYCASKSCACSHWAGLNCNNPAICVFLQASIYAQGFCE